MLFQLLGHMQDVENYREEYPNLSYVIALVGTIDFDFVQKFVAILEQEFTYDLGRYLFHIRQNEPKAAAEFVHKLRYKIEVLGMVRAYEFAERHKERLYEGDTSLDEGFKKILKKVDTFLKIQTTNKS